MSTASVPVALAATNAAGSAYGAYAQNRATRRSINSAKRAADAQVGQLQEAAALERQKRAAEALAIRGRIAVLAADSGFEDDGSFASLNQQSYVDELQNIQAINRNLYFQKARVLSGLDADLSALSSRYVNPIFAAIGGGASGYSTGLQIQSAQKGTA